MKNVIERNFKEYKRQLKKLENYGGVMFDGLIHVNANVNKLADHIVTLGTITRDHEANNLILAQTLKDAGKTTVTIDSGADVPINDWMAQASAVLENVDAIIAEAGAIRVS